MKLEAMKDTFTRRVDSAGRTVNTLAPLEAWDILVEFYRYLRVDGCAVEAGADLFLLRWGVANAGDGDTYQLEITRTVKDGATPWQLSLRYFYRPSAAMRQVPAGEVRCKEPKELGGQELKLRKSPAFTAVQDARPDRVVLLFGKLG